MNESMPFDENTTDNENTLNENDLKRFQKFSRQLDFFKEELQGIDRNAERRQFLRKVEEFREFLAERSDDPNLSEIYQGSKRYEDDKLFFRDANNFYMHTLEYQTAVSIITRTAHLPNDNNPQTVFEKGGKDAGTTTVLDRYLNKVTDLRSLDLSKAKKAVFVGCGSTPETMVFVAQEAQNIGNMDLKCVGLDVELHAINQAVDLVNHLGWQYQLQFIQTSGQLYEGYADADIVYIAGFVPEKKEILDLLVQQAPDHVQIIVETYERGLFHVLFESVVKNLHPRLFMEDKVQSTAKSVFKQIVKLVKKQW